jgi:hypothetical protein
VRLSLDVLWGIPSIVYGAFGFTLMLAVGLRASLLAGIIVLALLELPIMVRAMDEVIRRMPVDLEQAALALGSTKLEVALRVVTRQMLPGIITAVLLAFGRGSGMQPRYCSLRATRTASQPRCATHRICCRWQCSSNWPPHSPRCRNAVTPRP